MSGRGRPIVKHPDPRLVQKNDEVEIGKESSYIIRQLMHSMSNVRWGKAVGMAAPQIGINKRLFIVLFDFDHIHENDGKWGPQAFINPRIVEASKFRKKQEGCYSLEANRFDYEAKRPDKLTIEYQDVFGEMHREQFTGRMAQIVHHEYEHLEGRICAQPAKKKAKVGGAKETD